MRFGLSAYFDKLDISEAIGHEIAEQRSRKSTQITGRDLPFRSLIDDPFDCRRRAMLPAIATLTLRRGRSGETFLLHWRDPRKVATAAGIYDVIPAGEFQPSSTAPHDLTNDFDIWRNIVRELSEGTARHARAWRPVQRTQRHPPAGTRADGCSRSGLPGASVAEQDRAAGPLTPRPG